MAARMADPAPGVPGALVARPAFESAAGQAGPPPATAPPVHPHAIQVDGHTRRIPMDAPVLGTAGTADQVRACGRGRGGTRARASGASPCGPPARMSRAARVRECRAPFSARPDVRFRSAEKAVAPRITTSSRSRSFSPRNSAGSCRSALVRPPFSLVPTSRPARLTHSRTAVSVNPAPRVTWSADLSQLMMDERQTGSNPPTVLRREAQQDVRT
jgi:hypothetical protein